MPCCRRRAVYTLSARGLRPESIHSMWITIIRAAQGALAAASAFAPYCAATATAGLGRSETIQNFSTPQRITSSSTPRHSARLLRQEFPQLKSRIPTLWTNSYFVATVGGATLEVVKQYVENQRNV